MDDDLQMKDEFKLLDDRGRVFTADDADDYDAWEEAERRKRESSLPPPPAVPSDREVSFMGAPRPARAAPEKRPGPACEAEVAAPSTPPAPSAPPEERKRDFDTWYAEREEMLAAALERRGELQQELKRLEERLVLLGVRIDAATTQEPLQPVEGVEARVVTPAPKTEAKAKAKPQTPPAQRGSKEKPRTPPRSQPPTPPPAAQPQTAARPKPGSVAPPAGRGKSSGNESGVNRGPGTTYKQILSLLGKRRLGAGTLARELGVSYQTIWSALQRGVDKGDIVMIAGDGRTKTFRRAG